MNLRFDLRTLQIFVSVAETRNLTHAADRENIAVSAVSKRMVDLEEAVGTALLERQARGVAVTPAGQALLSHARAILRAVDHMAGDLSYYSEGVRGTVRLFVNMSAVVQFLPADLRAFADQNPEIRIEVEELNSSAILKGVFDGAADIGVFTYGGPHEAELEIHDYRRDRLVAIVANEHPLASRGSLRLDDLLAYQLVGPPSGSAWHGLLTDVARAAGKVLDMPIKAKSFDAVWRMVAVGFGVAVGPTGMLRYVATSNLIEVPLEEDWALRRIRIAIRKRDTLSAPARLMLDHLLNRTGEQTSLTKHS